MLMPLLMHRQAQALSLSIAAASTVEDRHCFEAKIDLCSSLKVNIVNANTCSAHNLQAALSCLKHLPGDLQSAFDERQVDMTNS